ncbi:MAG: glycosyltransferase family 2 protein [Candidatus Margulisiibacteriota bacterium]|nr:MAG: glycosyl transferase family 2 [Candidatus Margulisbacteria bacterium GWD2_39_127]OGI01844.1 MAG: glycosyl transferase family 2 [Candidatus Margulisbacteria bacterium GWF2_38_17]OGI10166.1 MAG: glycosyl transferase family 2 [Candidatus Margulisbacteria bacterium GWE2_39_32]PZM79497.1 MAG: glycosyltransferase family 2 protein [Candidatus Margulisiibacteriota bacterium]HAR63832.1 glycosyl transferase family 2 [Candidatus Margulisiibacteriota bacterium]
MKIPVSVMILTKNEEKNLPACLNSVNWSDDIHVFDSWSDDSTAVIARDNGAEVRRRVLDNWSSHLNWGLRNLPFKYRWILYINADERVSEELVQAIETAVNNPGENKAFLIERCDYFMGRNIKHVQASRLYIRFFLRDHMRYERLVNPVSVVDGNIGLLKGHLLHYPFSKGVTHWIEKHNSYSMLEARQINEDKKKKINVSLVKALFSKDYHIRSMHRKALYYSLPFRPFLMFFLLYIVKGGFLDGRSGFHYAVLRTFYEYMIVLKTMDKAGD